MIRLRSESPKFPALGVSTHPQGSERDCNAFPANCNGVSNAIATEIQSPCGPH